MVGILVIGSYVYHSDVVVTSMQNLCQYNTNMYHLLFTSLLHIRTSTDVTVFLRYLVVSSVDSGEFRMRMLIQ